LWILQHSKEDRMSKKLIGKVADLIDNRTLVINLGIADNVRPGMVFMVYDEVGKIVKDPISGVELGRLKVPKIEVKVTHVDNKYSVAETHKFREVNVGGTNQLMAVPNIFAPPRYVKKYETFQIDDTTKRQLDKEKSIVKIGDTVEQIYDAEKAIITA
jgi:hypothetical protein